MQCKHLKAKLLGYKAYFLHAFTLLHCQSMFKTGNQIYGYDKGFHTALQIQKFCVAGTSLVVHYVTLFFTKYVTKY